MGTTIALYNVSYGTMKRKECVAWWQAHHGTDQFLCSICHYKLNIQLVIIRVGKSVVK